MRLTLQLDKSYCCTAHCSTAAVVDTQMRQQLELQQADDQSTLLHFSAA
jgi:hypothetical protein